MKTGPHYTAWNGEMWAAPFRICDLKSCISGLLDRHGTSVCWDEDGFRGENWIRLNEWSDEKAAAIMSARSGGRGEKE
jgi:hypothetical protein